MIFLCTRYKTGVFLEVRSLPKSVAARLADYKVATHEGLVYETKLITAPSLLEAVNSEPEWFSAEPRKADDEAA